MMLRTGVLAALCLSVVVATTASATPGTTPGTKEHVRGKVKRHWDPPAAHRHRPLPARLPDRPLRQAGLRGPLARPALPRRPHQLRRVQGHRRLLRAEGPCPVLPAPRSPRWPRGPRPSRLLQRLQHGLVVRLRRHLREHPGHLALRVDHEGRALGAPELLDAVGVADRAVLVGQQGEVRARARRGTSSRATPGRARCRAPGRPARRSRRSGRGRRRPASCSRACWPWDRSRAPPAGRAARTA